MDGPSGKAALGMDEDMDLRARAILEQSFGVPRRMYLYNICA